MQVDAEAADTGDLAGSVGGALTAIRRLRVRRQFGQHEILDVEPVHRRGVDPDDASLHAQHRGLAGQKQQIARLA